MFVVALLVVPLQVALIPILRLYDGGPELNVGMATMFVPTAMLAPAMPFTAVGLADLFAPHRA